LRNLHLRLIVREKYLPYLLHENQLACLKVSFTVCDKPPIKAGNAGSTGSL